MKTTRRGFVRVAGAGAIGVAAGDQSKNRVSRMAPFDVAVIGAGVFGAWTAYHLSRAGKRVALVDAYGPGNARASSGGQSRVIRMGYGEQEIYTRWSMRSLAQWKELLGRTGRTAQFQQAGVLWLAREQDPLTTTTLETLGRLGIAHERLDRAAIRSRWPQIDPGPITWAIYEPMSGFLMAFHVVQAVAQAAISSGVTYVQERVVPPEGRGQLPSVRTQSGGEVVAGTFVMACGPWLPKLFPDVLGERIFPTRQEVFYFGVPAGDARFHSSELPVWVDFGEEIYGIPDFRGRGFKVALDRHGPPVDPDTLERIPSAESLAKVREFVGRRFPGLKNAPIVGTEVCQYENTSNGDFLIDRHPGLANVWLVGGGSGHGFKHGPAVGEYVAARISDGKPVDKKFSLATKQKVQKRIVY
jgi:monomeric sarcosine oxidase